MSKEKYYTYPYVVYEAEAYDNNKKIYGAMFMTKHKKTGEFIHCMLHNNDNYSLTVTRVKPDTVKLDEVKDE